MAQFTKRLSAGGNQYDLILDVNQSSQSIANNTSVVSWSLWIRKNSGSGYHASDTKSWSVNIGGQTKSGTIAGYNFSGKNSISLGSGSFTISHNADGTKSISASGTFTDSGVTGIGSGTASGSLTLTTIPRASSFGTISGSTLGSGITVNINRASSSFTHSMWYSFGTATWQVIGSGIGTSTTFTPPLSLGSQIPNTTSGTMTLILRTMNGTTRIGSDVTKTINVGIPGSVVPSAGTLSAAQGNSNNAGTYVQGFSSVKLTASGYAGSYGSTVRSVQITGAGHTFNANTGTTGALNNSGNVQFTSTITDSRGRKSYAYVTVNFLAYSPPQIVSASVQRTNASGVATWNGTYMKYTYHVKVASLVVGGAQKNNVKIVYFDYGANGANWGNATHTTVIEASGNKTYGTISVTSSVPARINAYDNMGRYATWTGQVSSGTVALDIGDNNVGVGKFWERGAIDASGQIYQNNGKKVLDESDVGSAGATTGMYGKIPRIGADGVMEVGQYIDFHASGTNNDYTARLHASGGANQLAIANSGIVLTTAHMSDYVVEHGSNYTKWNSGKLEQWGWMGANPVYHSVWGGFHYYTFNLGNYPIPFIAQPYRLFSTHGTGQLWMHIDYSPTTATSPGGVRSLHVTAGRTDWLNFHYYAIGRWK